MRILMVDSPSDELNAILDETGFHDRLISYMFIRNKPTFLEEYRRNNTRSRNGNKKDAAVRQPQGAARVALTG